MNSFPLLFELSVPGKIAWRLPSVDLPDFFDESLPGEETYRTELNLPELAEIDIVRHYTNLSTRNMGVDTNFYPLGSCTMKYNPKINENITRDPNFANLHPLAPGAMTQGAFQVMHELETCLATITGMDAYTLQPAAGAHGELTALLMIKKYLEDRGESHRTKILVPSSAHGTNPASAMMAGFETITVRCNDRGLVDLNHLRELLSRDIAALMLTNPNTLGLFERDIEAMARMVHEAGALLYYDGANLNAILGLVRPGDMGFDLIHLNLHKSFSTPHGGGGPGSGPVGVKAFLAPYLPTPVLSRNESGFYWDDVRPKSIGKVLGFYGNFAVLIKALAYIRALGSEGLTQVSYDAVLNANYLMHGLKEYYPVPYPAPCMHEFVLAAVNLKSQKVRALDIAKRLLDYGVHPPTIYFPLIVEEAMMIEPTETEDKLTLDRFIEIMIEIHRDAQSEPESIQMSPHHTPVARLDEATAARSPKLRWQP